MRSTHGEVDLEVVVVAMARMGDRVRRLVLRRREGGPLPAWAPGAHIDLTFGPGLVRQYSLCGEPNDTDVWNVAVLREDQSRGGSAFVHDTLEIGTTLAARGPRNHFPLVDAPDYLFIAGGIGITPLLPMISEVSARQLSWRLVYGGRRRSSMAFADDLVDRYGERVQLLPEDEHGQLSIASLMRFPHDDTALYCCGPEGLISAVESMHAHSGRGTLHVERFSPMQLDPLGSSDSFEVEASRSGEVVTVARETSILDALNSAGVLVLSSCEEGVCGTCEVAVLDGTPEHRDSILTDAEREANESMFVCVSRALSSRLVLDI
jgi:ferredoxin-NADP reductase